MTARLAEPPTLVFLHLRKKRASRTIQLIRSDVIYIYVLIVDLPDAVPAARVTVHSRLERPNSKIKPLFTNNFMIFRKNVFLNKIQLMMMLFMMIIMVNVSR